MKNYTHLMYMIIFLLIILNIFLLKRIYSEEIYKHELVNNFEILADNLNIEKHKNDLLKKYLVASLTNFSWELDPNYIVQDTNKETVTLKELNNNEFTLVFKFSNRECSTCIEQQLTLLRDISTLTNGKIKPLFLAEVSDWHNFKYYKEKFELKDLYFVTDAKLNINNNYDYLALIDQNFHTRFIYFPIKEVPEITLQFIEKLKTHF